MRRQLQLVYDYGKLQLKLKGECEVHTYIHIYIEALFHLNVK